MTDQPTDDVAARQHYESIQTALAAACLSTSVVGAMTALLGWIAVSIPLLFCALVFAVTAAVRRVRVGRSGQKGRR